MKPKRYLTYLASPYSHPKFAIRKGRYIEVTLACAWLMNKTGWNVFSPITHSHPLHEFADMRGDWPFWKKVDTQYLRLSKRVVVLKTPGWEQSTGVTAEREIARRYGIPILFIKRTKSGNFKFCK